MDEPAAPEPPREVVTLTINGRVHPITADRVVLGRSRECDIRVPDGNVSRRHAEIVREEGTYLLVDLDSTNGTDVNGRPVTRRALADGDTIRLGGTDVVFGRSVEHEQ